MYLRYAQSSSHRLDTLPFCTALCNFGLPTSLDSSKLLAPVVIWCGCLEVDYCLPTLEELPCLVQLPSSLQLYTRRTRIDIMTDVMKRGYYHPTTTNMVQRNLNICLPLATRSRSSREHDRRAVHMFHLDCCRSTYGMTVTQCTVANTCCPYSEP